jgi:uncharacterized protein YqgC (DUF456 family)
MENTLILLLVVLLMLGGVAGVILPVVPGTLLILAGALVHKLFATSSISWGVFVGLVVIAVVGQLLEMGASLLGAKWFGASKWGLLGAGLGLVAGLFFGLPGLILGPLAGAVVAELTLGKRTPMQAASSGLGAGVGLATGLLIKVGITLVLIGVFWLALWQGW